MIIIVIIVSKFVPWDRTFLMFPNHVLAAARPKQLSY